MHSRNIAKIQLKRQNLQNFTFLCEINVIENDGDNTRDTTDWKYQ